MNSSTAGKNPRREGKRALSFVGIAWSMVSSLGLLLGCFQLVIWLRKPWRRADPLVTTMASGAVALARLEMESMRRTAPADVQCLYWWDSVAIFAILSLMTCFVSSRLENLRRWLATAIGSVSATGFLIKFVISGNLPIHWFRSCNGIPPSGWMLPGK